MVETHRTGDVIDQQSTCGPKDFCEKKHELIKIVLNSIRSSDFETAREVLKENSEYKGEVSNSVLKACIKEIKKKLLCGHINDTKDILSFMNELPRKRINAIVFNACKKGLIENLSYGYAGNAKRISFLMEELAPKKNRRIVNTSEVLSACEKCLFCNLSKGDIADAQSIIIFMKKHGVSHERIKEIINSDQMLDACKKGLVKTLSKGDINEAKSILSLIREYGVEQEKIKKIVNSEEVISACKDGLIWNLDYEYIDLAKSILSFMEEHHISKEITKNLITIKDSLGCESVNDVFEYDGKFLGYAIKNGIKKFTLPDSIKDDLGNSVIKKCGFYAVFKEYEETNSFDFYSDKEKLHEILKKHDERWDDATNINGPLETGVEIFGFDKMFQYLNGKTVNLYDALHNFSNICSFSAKDPQGIRCFFYNILNQVAEDGGSYKEGNAYKHLNAIADSLVNEDIDEFLEKAKAVVDKLDDIKELSDNFKSQEDVFSSWSNLKQFMILKELLDDPELLDELVALREEDEALYNYIKPLLFGKDCRVDRAAVIEFWRNPDEFFARIDKNGEQKHEHLKPSNYAKYGLSGKELQQAIVHGKLDDIQLIKPCEITYIVSNMSLQDAVKRALGSRQNNIDGEAQNGGLIFDKIRALKINPLDIIQANVDIPYAKQEQIWKILESDEVMKSKITRYTVKATVHKKSDPLGAIVGDDTGCCMPFGSGKMNEYLTNLGTAIFSVKIQKGDGSWRTIAQSVLTADIDIGEQVSDLLEDIQNGHLEAIPLESFEKPLVLTCDNIEFAKNYSKLVGLVEDTYKVFFERYLSRYGKSINLDTSKVVIGKCTNDLSNFKTITNSYIPVTAIGYSDNLASESYVLYTNEKEDMSFYQVEEVMSEVVHGRKKGKYVLDTLNVQDILAIARFKEKVYGQIGGETGLADIQNEIIANLILCAKQNKPFLMFKVSNKNKKTLGFFIGYEREEDTEIGVYVSDFFVTLRKNQYFTGVTMLLSFIERYIDAYKSKEAFPPIEVRLRDETSRDVISDIDKLNKHLRKYNLIARVNDEKIERRGDEIMYHAVIDAQSAA